MPVRLARFAIDDRTAQWDLYLLPLHCIYFKEALIPVMYLINETSIAQGALHLREPAAGPQSTCL